MQYIISSEQEMMAFGLKLGALLKGGEVIELVGDVGAGKTTLTKGIARGFGVDEDVQSPSFTLSRTYETGHGAQLVHYDFYRLADPGILAAELADTVGQADTVTVIEWADIVEGVLPEGRIKITIIASSETDRTVTVTGVAV